MIEKGTHLRIPAKDRLCNKCNTYEIEDEFHAVIMCPANTLARKELWIKLNLEIEKWDSVALEAKFFTIMQAKTCPYEVSKFFMYLLNNQ